jgi:hypothetical protein
MYLPSGEAGEHVTVVHEPPHAFTLVAHVGSLEVPESPTRTVQLFD